MVGGGGRYSLHQNIGSNFVGSFGFRKRLKKSNYDCRDPESRPAVEIGDIHNEMVLIDRHDGAAVQQAVSVPI